MEVLSKLSLAETSDVPSTSPKSISNSSIAKNNYFKRTFFHLVPFLADIFFKNNSSIDINLESIWIKTLITFSFYFVSNKKQWYASAIKFLYMICDVLDINQRVKNSKT